MNIERVFTEEHKQKLRESHKGCAISPEHRRKISEALVGHVPSQQTRDFLSESAKRRVRKSNGTFA